jgi:hypothetical protein
MSMGWDYVSELQSPMGILLIPQVIYSGFRLIVANPGEQNKLRI